MDPITAGLILVTKVLEFRMQWWASLPPETRAALAKEQAEGELRWLAFLERIAKD